ncbi:MAG: sigma-70 family RNA polymerase sigma factor [Gemmataceae bacterium]
MWPEGNETREILDRVRSGQPEAVDQLLNRHREPVRRMIGLRLDPALAARVDASDIVQEVMLEASKRLGDYLKNPGMPFHLWLRHLAKDHIIDAHRRHRQAQRRSVDREKALQANWPDRSSLDLAGELIDRELTPASAALRQELQRRLRSVLEEMGEDDREVLLMRHFEQMSNQEVADALGLSEAAAGMRHLRALRRLRELLDKTP